MRSQEYPGLSICKDSSPSSDLVARTVCEGQIVVDYRKINAALNDIDQMLDNFRVEVVSLEITSGALQVKDADISTFNFKIVTFDQYVSEEQALDLIKKDGWEVGKLEHILSFADSHRMDWKEYSSVSALGTKYGLSGYVFIPNICRRSKIDRSWKLDLFLPMYGFKKGTYFIAVR